MKQQQKFITQNQILDLLKRGIANAVPVTEIAKRLNSDNRTIRQQIHNLRKIGVPVLGSSSEPYGIFLAETQSEIDGFLKQETARANSTLEIVEILQKFNFNEEEFQNV